MRSRSVALALMLVSTMAGAMDGSAQRRPSRPSRDSGAERPTGYVGIGLLAADAIGDLDEVVGQGFGAQLEGAFPVDRDQRIRLRGDLGFLVYGHERRRVCFSPPVGCRIELDLTTTNSIVFGGLGPEVILLPGPIQPYVNGAFGFSWFGTTSSLKGERDGSEFASTTNFSDAVFAWRAGGGIRVRVKDGPRPVAIDFGIERHENGIAELLGEGDIVDRPDGGITLYPTRGDADLLAFRLGVNVGLSRGRRGR